MNDTASMPSPVQQEFSFRLSVQLWVHGDITVTASSQEEAEAEVERQLGQRDSMAIDTLIQSASEQLSKEIQARDVEVQPIG